MDEQEWLGCTDPRPMLNYLRVEGKVTRTRSGRRLAVTRGRTARAAAGRAVGWATPGC